MKRLMINYMATFLHECGIEIIKENSRKTPYRKLWRLLAMGAFFSTIILWSIVYSFLHLNDFYDAISTMPFSSGTFTLLSAVSTVFHFRKKLSLMLYEMDNNMYTYPDEDLINQQIKYEWYLEEENIVVVMKIIFYLHLLTITTIAVPGFTELCLYGQIKTFLYPNWTPWAVDDVKSQMFTLFFQYFTLVCGATISMINILTLYVTFFELCRQYKRLIFAVGLLKRRTDNETRVEIGEGQEEHFNRILRANIVHCIQHFQVNYKNMHVFETWFSEYFSYEMAVYVLSFSFGLFVTINAPSLQKVINQLAVMIYTNLSFLTKCMVADVLIELNDDLARALFSQVEWYEVDEHNRRLIRIFHVFVRRKPVRLLGFSIFKANRVTFAEVLRYAYSVFNVMSMKN